MDFDKESNPGFSTRAIHEGQAADPATGAVIPPIHLSTTFRQPSVGVLHSGYEYSRSDNPTRSIYEECIASLEAPGNSAAQAFATSSGLGAADCVIRSVLTPGDHVVLPNDLYGGTYRLFEAVSKPWGIDNSVVDTSDLEKASTVITATRPKLVWFETPSNPTLAITDIAKLSHIAHEVGSLVVVDNTFATPYLQQPLSLGADFVVHSATKYLGGHSDLVGGVIVTENPVMAERIAYFRNAIGNVPSPFDCWLALRGVKTLALRLDRQCESAAKLANELVDHPQVEQVMYPGLKSHPQHEVAAKQMKDFGAMVSFRLSGGVSAARTVCEDTELFTLAESLGAVESLIESPALMTHQSVSGSQLEVPDDLVRISVGIEDYADIRADLFRALDSLA